jgi:hypothetical protein
METAERKREQENIMNPLVYNGPRDIQHGGGTGH